MNENEIVEITVEPDTFLVRSTDGRVFVDADSWVTAAHQGVHITQEVVALMRGTEYAEGQHSMIIVLHESVDDLRHTAGLPPTVQAQDMSNVSTLEDMFNSPAFGEGE